MDFPLGECDLDHFDWSHHLDNIVKCDGFVKIFISAKVQFHAVGSMIDLGKYHLYNAQD